MDEIEIKKVVETLLFITDQPLPVERIAQICNLKENKIQKALDGLEEDYGERTFQIMNIAGGYQMATRQEYSLWIRRLYNNRMTVRLSAAALETLSIIAYKQPITRAEVEAIRGVEVIGPLETLLERRLVTTVGRKESVGRPLLYGTTKEFLRQFGLNSLDNLPDIKTLVDQEIPVVTEEAAPESFITEIDEEVVQDKLDIEIADPLIEAAQENENHESEIKKETDISDEEIVSLENNSTDAKEAIVDKPATVVEGADDEEGR
ncbi:MAG: SMC-Scp complex subunit ScpB [Elusimicrobia bacterium]|nr:SMC-Scp complex subunit ScpB [Elusimicrobiota bacterium]